MNIKINKIPSKIIQYFEIEYNGSIFYIERMIGYHTKTKVNYGDRNAEFHSITEKSLDILNNENRTEILKEFSNFLKQNNLK